ncbi:hypothetical protein [Clavibacter michiganensis]|uniref:Uncharacterized protein n=1 Tax=Clavibacter michiganensis subsp. insidiosus TaxID=33014 RepID=A0A399SPU3_9MICO|nr:hypothetical protein [Clavibacter michiganensis]OQJ57033.1 hypothetical protein B5P21_15795 [Clavibacter michiganensis subsp. insidiosus]RIJ44974.1 hypothetical protein DZF93_00750 [Clavibacter michiganensis subsp. insidiosus]RMC83559.1 hypothetical protein CmiCFBP2404_14715 [Clavibacter michiganensis subsp. insidiosus]
MSRKTILTALAVLVVLSVIVGLMLAARSVPAPQAATSAAPMPDAAAPSPSTSPDEPADRAQAFAAAAAFCRPDVDSGTWQRTLDPYLTDDARALYAATAPANVPCEDVRDDGGPVGDQQTLTDAAWQFDAAVGGPVTVTLHRDSTAAVWLVSYVNPTGYAP